MQVDYLKYQHQLRLSKRGDDSYVFDPVRQKNVALTPEELLRQLVLLFLIHEKKYPLRRIRVEIGIAVNGLQKRCDIVVFDEALKPWLLVECKSPKVKLTQATFEQAARYNLQLQAPYLAVTNGLATYCSRLFFEEKTFEYLDDFPQSGTL